MNEAKISVHIGRTINLGNFNSLKIDAGLEETVPVSETYDDAYRRLWNLVDREITKVLTAYSKEKKEVTSAG